MNRVRAIDGGVRVHLRLTPKGGRDALEGWSADANGVPHLKARVRAVPEDGKANVALIALLAKTLGIGTSAVRIAAGHSARLKAVDVLGDTAVLCAKFEQLGLAK